MPKSISNLRANVPKMRCFVTKKTTFKKRHFVLNEKNFLVGVTKNSGLIYKQSILRAAEDSNRPKGSDY